MNLTKANEHTQFKICGAGPMARICNENPCLSLNWWVETLTFPSPLLTQSKCPTLKTTSKHSLTSIEYVSTSVIKQLQISTTQPRLSRSLTWNQHSIPRYLSSPTPAYYSQHRYIAPYAESLISGIVLPKGLNLWVERPETVPASYDH